MGLSWATSPPSLPALLHVPASQFEHQPWEGTVCKLPQPHLLPHSRPGLRQLLAMATETFHSNSNLTQPTQTFWYHYPSSEPQQSPAPPTAQAKDSRAILDSSPSLTPYIPFTASPVNSTSKTHPMATHLYTCSGPPSTLAWMTVTSPAGLPSLPARLLTSARDLFKSDHVTFPRA